MTSAPFKVLLVDDEASVRITLAANLELEGFEVTEAASGEEAVSLAKEQTFDVVMSDIRMGGMNGVELARQIRIDTPDMPVILMTAFAKESIIKDAMHEGVFTVLRKPVTIDHLLQIVSRASKKPLVLVVDDVEAHAVSTAAACEAAGLRARPAFDAKSALTALRDGNFDVCVVDLLMPEVNGARLIAEIARDYPDVVTIAISGYSVPEMMAAVSTCGAVACMRKPLDCRHLFEVIATARGAVKRRAGGM